MKARDTIHISGLTVPCVIGVYEWERHRRQRIVLDLAFPCDARRAASRDRFEDALDYKRIAKAAYAFAARSRFQLVETLAERLAAHLLGLGLEEVTLTVSKPGALRHTKDVSVTVTRRANLARAYFSLGSDLRPQDHLPRALESFRSRFASVTASSVYATTPVGTRRKTEFWNAVVGISCVESAAQLRRWAVRLEASEGRRRVKDKNAPRTLDVDLLDWVGPDGLRPKGAVPHADITLKAYVLFPFLEIAPRWVHPVTGRTLVEEAAGFQEPGQTIRHLPDVP